MEKKPNFVDTLVKKCSVTKVCVIAEPETPL